LIRIRKQLKVVPAGEDRRLHGDHPGLSQRSDPRIQLMPGGADLAFTVHKTQLRFSTQKQIVLLPVSRSEPKSVALKWHHDSQRGWAETSCRERKKSEKS